MQPGHAPPLSHGRGSKEGEDPARCLSRSAKRSVPTKPVSGPPPHIFGPFPITHLMVDETGHPPETEDRVSGLEGAVQGHTGLACQRSKGRPDAEDTLLAVDVKLEVSRAVRPVLDPQSLFGVLPEREPVEVDTVMLQCHIRT